MNVFVALTQLIQLARAYNYAQQQKAAEKQGAPAPEPVATVAAVAIKN